MLFKSPSPEAKRTASIAAGTRARPLAFFVDDRGNAWLNAEILEGPLKGATGWLNAWDAGSNPCGGCWQRQRRAGFLPAASCAFPCPARGRTLPAADGFFRPCPGQGLFLRRAFPDQAEARRGTCIRHAGGGRGLPAPSATALAVQAARTVRRCSICPALRICLSQASGLQRLSAFSFAPSSGRRLGLDGLFKDPVLVLRLMTARCARVLEARLGPGFIEDGVEPIPENYARLVPAGDGLAVLFPECQAAVYGREIQVAAIPLDPLSPAGPFPAVWK